MRRPRHLFSLQGAVLAALVVCLAGSGPVPARETKAKHGHRARKRQALLRQLRHNPRIALRRSFIRQASELDLDLPLTVRLNRAVDSTPSFTASNDVLEIAWTNDAGFWPGGFSLPPTPVTDVSLSRGFTMAAHFGADTAGYGQPGVLETTQGDDVTIETATAGLFDVANADPPCAAATVRIDSMSLGRGEATQGILNLFGSQARGSLHVRATTASSARATCNDGWVAAGSYTSTSPDPVLPITFAGAFRVSPAITADGYLRLGTISVSDSVVAQTSSFGQLKVCTQPAAPSCGLVSFPARLKLKELTAELLVGQVAL
jgi:hypothetical protein